MIYAKSTPKPGENSWLWLLKIVSGILIVVILIAHLVVNHFTAPEGLLSYDEVVRYYQNPLIPIMEGFFLAFVVGHSLLGVRSIVLDLNPSQQSMRLVNFVLTLVGVVSFVYGIWLLVVVAGQGVNL